MTAESDPERPKEPGASRGLNAPAPERGQPRDDSGLTVPSPPTRVEEDRICKCRRMAYPVACSAQLQKALCVALLSVPKLEVENVAPRQAQGVVGLVVARTVEMVVEYEAVERVEGRLGLLLRRSFQPGTCFPRIGGKCLDRGSGA